MEMTNAAKVVEKSTDRTRTLNYSLRPAKNIERKMLGEAFARLSPIAPLTAYRYVGFGSEFFNDFSLYHQKLGIKDMVSIERDADRIERCAFNQPYKCVRVVPGTATQVLPQLDWRRPTIVWLDYTDKLDKAIVDDIRFTASQVCSGSMGIWTVNAHPWGGPEDSETHEKVKQSDWPQRRLAKLKNLFGSSRTFPTLTGSELSNWGLAREFHAVIVDEIQRALNDRNAGTEKIEQIQFRQCFHFRYADGQRMLTVGGLFVNESDERRLGTQPFTEMDFIRDGRDSLELKPPTLTGREVRYLNQLLPHDGAGISAVKWLKADEIENFKKLYRYYPVFAESEL
jgi:hypothetical protein